MPRPDDLDWARRYPAQTGSERAGPCPPICETPRLLSGSPRCTRARGENHRPRDGGAAPPVDRGSHRSGPRAAGGVAFGPEEAREWVERTARGDRRVARAWLDSLDQQGERPRYGYWGVSMGTTIGLPFVASEPRVSAAVLGLAGLGKPCPGPTASDGLARTHDPCLARPSVERRTGRPDIWPRAVRRDRFDREDLAHQPGRPRTDPPLRKGCLRGLLLASPRAGWVGVDLFDRLHRREVEERGLANRVLCAPTNRSTGPESG